MVTVCTVVLCLIVPVVTVGIFFFFFFWGGGGGPVSDSSSCHCRHFFWRGDLCLTVLVVTESIMWGPMSDSSSCILPSMRIFFVCRLSLLTVP